ncbi:hypothetical protein GQ44DRAFT_773708 [Phaeosphaeriaceae sp. PMI808]|nr:hypothetical protein GQ44DRAFT_773708 [Phaeosphaeriaceae sp. PMI808]
MEVTRYSIGWIAPLPLELTAARAVLDEDYGDIHVDDYCYHGGRIGQHNIVMAVQPQMGTDAASDLAARMRAAFRNIQYFMVVGIGGGVPSYGPSGAQFQIVLGDVVVSYPRGSYGGVIRYDFGAWTDKGGLEFRWHTNSPPDTLLNAVNGLQSRHMTTYGTKIPAFLLEMRLNIHVDERQKFEDQGAARDRLFQDNYLHPEVSVNEDCENCCDSSRSEMRERRGDRAVRQPDTPKIHYGNIASSNQLQISASKRNQLHKDLGVICFEMEGAGVIQKHPCLVIRGICDYSDSHKNKKWQPYAAATAAAYTKELLEILPASNFTPSPLAKQIEEPALEMTSALTLPGITKRSEWQMLLRSSGIPEDGLLERLSDYDYERAYRWRRRCRIEHTTNWIRKHPDFVAWLDGREPRCIWLSGTVGCGKSIIMTTVIETAVAKAQVIRKPVLQFIFDHSFRQHLTARALFESYTKQLLVHAQRKNTRCPSAVIERILQFYAPKRHRPNTQELIDEVLIPLYQMFEETGAILLVDGVDECSQRETFEILSGLRQLLKLPSCRVFICSRQDVDVLRGIPGTARIQITPADTKTDLEVFVDREVKERQHERLISSNKAVIEEVKRKILEKADGMFLWAKYLIKMLWEDCIGQDATDKAVYETLKMLPKDLNETYERCLERVNRDSKRRSLADCILKWICVSMVPFNIIQLQEALIVDPNSGESGDDSIPKEEILTCCASLAYFQKDASAELVLLAHHSVRQFLFPLGAESGYTTTQVELGELCVAHLYRHRPVKELITHGKRSSTPIRTLRIPRSPISTIGSIVLPGIFKSLSSTRSDHQKSAFIQLPKPTPRKATMVKETGFMSYAKKNWMLLTSNLSRSSRHWSSFEKLALPNDRSWDIYPWPQQGYQALDSHVFRLYAWSILNCHYSLLSLTIAQKETVKRDIFNLPLFDDVGQLTMLPLPAAAATGDTKIVEYLLKILPKVNEQHSYALHVACSKGYVEVVQLLLEAGTDINTKAGNLGSALQAAKCQGHDRLVRYLIDAGVELTIRTLKGHSSAAMSVAFSPNGGLVASASYDSTVRLWDPATGALCHTLKGHSDAVMSVAFSPDGGLVASASNDSTVRLWDSATGALCHTLKGHSSAVMSVAFSPNGGLVASASYDCTVRLWDSATGALCHTLKGHSDAVRSVAFSPDGGLVASASQDSTVRLWDSAMGALCHALKGHSGGVASVAFSPNGGLVASASDDCTVRLWDSAVIRIVP